MSLFLRVSLFHSITVNGFAELIFTSLIRISALNAKSRHYATHVTARRVVKLCQEPITLAVPRSLYLRQLAHPTYLALRD